PAQAPAQSNPFWRPFDNEQSQTTLRSEADSKRQVEIMKLMYANKDIDQELIWQKYISSVPAEKLSVDIRLARLWMKSIGRGPSTKQKSNIELMDDTILEIALSIKDGFDNHKPVSIEQIKTKYGISNKLAIEYYETAKSLARMYGDESVINPEMAITRTDMKSSPGKQSQLFDIVTPAQVSAQSNDVSQPLDNEQSQTTLQKRLLGKRDAERAVDDMRNKRARKDELDSVPVPLEDPVNNSVQLPIVTPPGEGEVDMN
ncbi:MAG: hypothetical protein N0C82_18145, partial [Candidatus Thiodiazotropha endolucinida]|nr:hypothetical protein [Candidatus Thiodiazotropha taylori]MCW4297229.1 hypothetical protein [Candidatus Thiodiazotropha endolucinida]